METVFTSDELPPEERLARFNEAQVDSVHPMRVTSGSPETFRATARALDLASVNVVELTCSPSEVSRTRPLIKAADPELYSVIFPLRGQVGVVQADREARLSPDDFALYDSSQPFRLHLESEWGPTTLIRAHVPRELFPLATGAADRLLALPLPGQKGIGALLTQFLTRLTTDSALYRPSDAPQLAATAVDLINAVLMHHLDAASEDADHSDGRVLVLRIQSFIQQHLREPWLSPGTVAGAHHISLSHLHRLFEAQETTVAAWIRQQRLGRASRDLADPALRNVPISRIAARWGFNDHSTFTRAFRSAHGIPPKGYRQHALGLPGQAPRASGLRAFDRDS